MIELAGNETLTMLAQMVRHIIDTASRKPVERDLDVEPIDLERDRRLRRACGVAMRCVRRDRLRSSCRPLT
ncbi:MAG TPA: hypothetical protein VI248_12570 [Kineosporiaceae bacterium]